MTCSRPAWILALLAAALLPAAGCGDPPAAGVSNPAPEAADEDPWKDAPATRIRFRNVSDQAGIAIDNHSGRPGRKEFLTEAVGPGASWLDYDGDGLMDIFIPDGDLFRNYVLETIKDPVTGRLRPVLTPAQKRLGSYPDQLWRNNGDGTFTDVAEAATIGDTRWSFGSTACDYDGDGDQDLYVANFGLNALWRNNGDGTFTDVAAEVGVQGDAGTWSTSASVGDVDDDGRLDFFVAAYSDPAVEVERVRQKRGLPVGTPVQSIGGRDCNWRGLPAYCGPIGLRGQHDTLLRQRADGTFEDVTDAWGLRPRLGLYAFTTLMFDFNDDGLLDIYVANDSEQNFMWQQERDDDGRIRFRDTSDVLAIKVGGGITAQASMGMSVCDVNQDGELDIFITNFSHDYNNLYVAKRVPGSGSVYYKDRGLQTMGGEVFNDLSWGCGWYDFDNDGDRDLYVANGHVYKEIDLFEKTGTNFDQLNALFESMDPARLAFREIGAKAQRNAAPGVDVTKLEAGDGTAVELCSRQAAFCDWNNDGRMDVLVQNMNTVPTVLLNDSLQDDRSQWVKFSLRQPGGNREALGAKYEVRAEGRAQRGVIVRQTSFLGCDDPRTHVGLGTARRCDIVVTWPGQERAQSEFLGLEAGKHWLLERATGEASELPLTPFPVR